MFRWEHIGDLMVAVHDHNKPTDPEWDAFVADLASGAALPRAPAGLLVVTFGGGPTALQRQRLQRLYESWPHQAPVAVLTESRLVLGIVTAMQWMMPRFRKTMKAFRLRELGAALKWLELDGRRTAQVHVCLRSLGVRTTPGSEPVLDPDSRAAG